MYRNKYPGFILFLVIYLISFSVGASPEKIIQELRLPPGFQVEVFAQVPGARSLEVASDLGVVFVGTRGSRVYAIDLKTRIPRVFASGLKVANGIAYRDGFLYIAEQHRVIRVTTDGSKDVQILFDGLPDKSHHGWRYATFGPDDRLYISVGAPCNICTVNGLEGKIIALSPRGGKPELVALGVRNPVGLAFHPKSQLLYFTDNGADNMGDDSPPDELNRLDIAGQHFGYPWFGGGQDRTPKFARQPLPEGNFIAPVIKFGAHVAALGIHFYSGSMFPPEYRDDAFVAQHGSWNRSSPVGYRVVRVRFDQAGQPVSYDPFIEGWLNEGSTLGRPVDVAELPDGSLLVSDDYNDLIWRITYQAP